MKRSEAIEIMYNVTLEKGALVTNKEVLSHILQALEDNGMFPPEIIYEIEAPYRPLILRENRWEPEEE